MAFRIPILILIYLFVLPGHKSHGNDIWKHYSIENIPPPAKIDSQVGGMDFTPDGRLAVCFHRGEVATYNTETKEWTMFAQGLHEPLGLVALSDTEFVIMQRPELTKISDTDGDGKADTYETLYDGFGMTGNYHEFAFGPVVDENGDFYISLNVASNGASVREEVRGEWMEIGLPRADFYGEDWKKKKGKAGRMYSRVPYRGWVVKIDGKTGEATPWASGFRSPNSLGFDKAGKLWVCDNQGDWIGTNKLHHVRKDHFYGHAASLVWREGWKRNPLDMDVAKLDQLRSRAAVLMPQGSMANSPTQPHLIDASGKFGPYDGQMLTGEMNQPRIIRLILEEVAGVQQGACIPLFDQGNINQGNNRLVFDKNGALWVGQTHLSWVGGKGIQKITWNGTVAPDVQSISLTKKGFDLTFTKPFDTKILAKPENYELASYYYEYHQDYGSKEFDKTTHTIKKIEVSDNGKTVSLTLDRLKPGYVYQFRLDKLKAADGEPISNSLLCYTINRLRDGTKPPAHIEANRIE